jgi:hypothetical protein
MASAKGFEIGPAAQRARDLEQDFAGTRMGRNYLTQLKPTRLDQHSLSRQRLCAAR